MNIIATLEGGLMDILRGMGIAPNPRNVTLAQLLIALTLLSALLIVMDAGRLWYIIGAIGFIGLAILIFSESIPDVEIIEDKKAPKKKEKRIDQVGKFGAMMVIGIPVVGLLILKLLQVAIPEPTVDAWVDRVRLVIDTFDVTGWIITVIVLAILFFSAREIMRNMERNAEDQEKERRKKKLA